MYLLHLLRNSWDPMNWGPNVPASIICAVAIIIHNEVRVARRDIAHHASTRQLIRDELRQVFHPAEEAEHHVAEDVATDVRKGADAHHEEQAQADP